MGQFLPDWMFAAFAIGGWELFDLVARRWHWPHARFIGAGIVFVCVVVLVIRFVIRYIQRKRRPEVQNPDDWKNY